MSEDFAYRQESNKPFDEVVAKLEELSPQRQFRVLAVHDVQGTLAEKGFERGPLKIIEVCNAGFAYEALEKDSDVALFMPCKYSVYTEGDKTIVKLGLPSMISQMMPKAGLDKLAAEVESKLKAIVDEVV